MHMILSFIGVCTAKVAASAASVQCRQLDEEQPEAASKTAVVSLERPASTIISMPCTFALFS